MSLTDNIRTRGRAPLRLPTVLGVRSLTSDEVESHAAREIGVKASPLQRISSRHRHLAHLTASGMSTSEAAVAVGLSISRVSILKADPTFQELVARREKELADAGLGFHEKAEGLTLDMLDELQERIELDPDSFSIDELLDGVTKIGDRTGHAPKRVEEKHHFFNIGDRLAQARERATKLIESEVTDLDPEEGAA